MFYLTAILTNDTKWPYLIESGLDLDFLLLEVGFLELFGSANQEDDRQRIP